LEYGVSKKTIERRLDKVKVVTQNVLKPGSCIVLMDTTYFGRNFGVLLMRDSKSNVNLYYKYVRHETIADYEEGIQAINSKDFKIDGIVCDGKRGMFNTFKDYRVQMCQFHQVKIVLRYITRKPRMQASKEFKELMHLLCQTDKESFIGGLNQWYERWFDFINERVVDKQTGKSRYIHRRLRSAYNSVKRNLPWLFTWYENLDVGIPNTNNALEGYFTSLKNKLRNHNGMSMKRKKKFIDEFFKV